MEFQKSPIIDQEKVEIWDYDFFLSTNIIFIEIKKGIFTIEEIFKDTLNS